MQTLDFKNLNAFSSCDNAKAMAMQRLEKNIDLLKNSPETDERNVTLETLKIKLSFLKG